MNFLKGIFTERYNLFDLVGLTLAIDFAVKISKEYGFLAGLGTILVLTLGISFVSVVLSMMTGAFDDKHSTPNL